MIELPEALVLARELNDSVVGKRVKRVYPPSSEHKFCWFSQEPETYDELMSGHYIQNAKGFGIFVEIYFDKDIRLHFNDGVNIRYLAAGDIRPEKYQLLIDFTDDTSLVFTVAMYGGIICYKGVCDNEYYIKSSQSISPLSEEFDQTYFDNLISSVKDTKSVKALLATEQRIPGLGNGVLQDILFQARIHPKRKIRTLSQNEKETLLNSIKETLKKMAEHGGRDTEKNLFGQAGGYRTLLSKKTISSGCPECGGEIIKKAYLGGAVYYCPVCQELKE